MPPHPLPKCPSERNGAEEFDARPLVGGASGTKEGLYKGAGSGARGEKGEVGIGIGWQEPF